MSVMESVAARKPDHVPPLLVHNFDLFNLACEDADIQKSFHEVQKTAPPIFWTPHNGGHWVATRADDIEAILRDPARFSSERVFIPMDTSVPQSLPVEADPPVHGQYRKPLNRALFPSVVDSIEPKIVDLTNELIDAFIDRGHCEFMSEFAKIFPITVFLDLVDLPRTERHWLVPIAHQFSHSPSAQARAEAQSKIFDFLGDTVKERRANPKDDLLSIICNAPIDGERISEDKAIAFAALVLFGGLDTVASMMGFFIKFLANNDRHRHQLIERLDDDKFVKAAVEELMRRHGMVNIARIATEDMEFSGVQFRKGDMILPPNQLLGLDEDLTDNPLDVDFERASIRHAAFGHGPHLCPGAHLARRELKVFLQIWLRRIPEFSIRQGTLPVVTMHVAATVERLELTWPVN